MKTKVSPFGFSIRSISFIYFIFFLMKDIHIYRYVTKHWNSLNFDFTPVTLKREFSMYISFGASVYRMFDCLNFKFYDSFWYKNTQWSKGSHLSYSKLKLVELKKCYECTLNLTFDFSQILLLILSQPGIYQQTTHVQYCILTGSQF